MLDRTFTPEEARLLLRDLLDGAEINASDLWNLAEGVEDALLQLPGIQARLALLWRDKQARSHQENIRCHTSL